MKNSKDPIQDEAKVNVLKSAYAALNQAYAKLEAQQQDDSIAVIGMACELPGNGDSLQNFWTLLKNNEDAITEVPLSRWDHRKNPPDLEDFRWGGFIEHHDKFDAAFFNVSSREAELMDPQQRRMLEIAWKALEDANYSPDQLNCLRCGVYVGAMHYDYLELLHQDSSHIDAFELFGNSPSGIAARIAYFLNLKGPSMVVDTACSSSATAVHLACTSIRTGEVDLALVGGVSLMLSHRRYLLSAKAGMLSKRGRCKTFDDSADGFVPGEGVGAVVLKPLKQALTDGDCIYGVILASGINQDGKTNGIAAPSAIAQTELQKNLYRGAKISPETISYIEAHGTGTKLGDPIEVKALTDAFQAFTDQNNFCAVGSVKTNIGHTGAAAGVVSLIKVLLALRHKYLPASLHLQRENQHISFKDTPFYVNIQGKEWVAPTGSHRRAAMNSFGHTGTNVHLVIEEAPERTFVTTQTKPYYFIAISANHLTSLHQRINDLYLWSKDHRDVPIEVIAYTLNTGRGHFKYRCVCIVQSTEEFQTTLEQVLQKYPSQNYLISEGKTVDKFGDNEQLAKLQEELKAYLILAPEIYQKKLHHLAQLYLQGYKIDWQGLHEGELRQKINLPSYPFLKERYWVMKTAAVSHPFMGWNVSTGEQLCFKILLSGEEFYLTDHKVGGENVLPGVAYLEMARFAAESVVEKRKVTEFRNIVWLQPLVVKETPMEVNIHFERGEDTLTFKATTFALGTKVTHAQGELRYGIVGSPAPWANILALAEGLPWQLSADTLYARLDTAGLSLGHGFRTVVWVKSNSEEALGYFSLPKKLKTEHADFFLHPGLLDGVLQSVMGLRATQDEKVAQLSVPYSLDRFTLYSGLPDEGYVYIRETKPHSMRFDLQVTDKNGSICLDILGFYIRASALSDVEKNQPQLQYYTSVWNAREQPLATIRAAKIKNLCLVSNDTAWVNKIRALFPDYTIINLQYGSCYIQNDQYTYQVRFNELTDYLVFFATLRQQGFILNHFILGEDTGSSTNDIESYLDTWLQGKIILLQSLMRTKHETEVRLLVPYYHKTARLMPEVMLTGFAKSLQQEHPHYHLQLVGLDPSTLDEKIQFLQLINELEQGSEFHVRYQGNERQVEYYLPIVDTQIACRPHLDIPLRQHGVYLITGGLGGLGLIFAEHLARVYQAKLVLTGRAILTEQKQNQLSHLKTLGAEVTYLSGDVSDKATVEDWVVKTKSYFGNVHGIIHCAGLLKDGLLHQKDWSTFKSVLLPKIGGVLQLDAATQAENLECFVVFSSLIGCVGNVGQTDYATANAFVDSFIVWRNEQVALRKRRGKSLSIIWPYWAEGGMQLAKTTEKHLIDKWGMKILPSSLGIEAFEACLSQTITSHCLVAYGDSKRMQYLFEHANSKSITLEIATSSLAADTLFTPHLAPPDSKQYLESVKYDLKVAVTEVLKVSYQFIDSAEKLSDYGFDSITFTELASYLEQHYEFLMTPALFFEYMTIDAVALYLCQNQPSKVKTRYSGLEKNGEAKRTDHPVSEQASLAQGLFHQDIGKEEKKQQEKTQKIEFLHAEDIAIIGMSGKFPGSPDLATFWENLIHSKDLIQEIPKSRWDWTMCYGDSDNQTKVKWGGFVDDVDQFDAAFFNISRREAELMDPQQRLFLETVWQTIEDSGYTPEQLAKTRTGLFVGVAGDDYKELLQDIKESSAFVPTGTAHSVLANRISYFLNLKGPSEAIDTACSSSLVAVHNAIKAIHTGDCEVAIAGGVNALLTPTMYFSFSKAGMLSEEGRCKTFDKSANGYVRGEGVAAILLKPLPKAILDNDIIYGVIKGSAVNHGGHVNSLTVPNPNAQAELITAAVERAKIEIETLTYIETHGTGTSLGDPIEINGLKKAFSISKNADTHYCGLGSVKTNIGHLETAAGIAGIIKVLLSMKHEKIPGNLHFSELNPYIELKDSPFYIVDKTTEWMQLERSSHVIPRRAGVSSFGFGGANAHVVLEEAPKIKESSSPVKPFYLIVLSAKTKQALKQKIHDLNNWLNKQSVEPHLENISYTLNSGRSQFDKRCAIVVGSLQELKTSIQGINNNQDLTNVFINWEGNVNPRNYGIVREVYKQVLHDIKHNKQLSDSDYYDKLLALGNFYTEGYDLDWEHLYQGEPRHRISLPTYPFAKERYWIPESTFKRTTQSAQHGMGLCPPLGDNLLLETVQSDIVGMISDLLKINHALDNNKDLSEYGMDSINLNALANNIGKYYEVELIPATLFEHNTVTRISRHLIEHYHAKVQKKINLLMDSNQIAAPISNQGCSQDRALDTFIAPIEHAIDEVSADKIWVNQYLPLSLGQERLWFSHKLNPQGTAYNIGTAIRLSGKLNVNALFRACQDIICRHEILRTVFIEVDGTVSARVLPHLKIDQIVLDRSVIKPINYVEEFEQAFQIELNKPFNLETGPLVHHALLRYAPDLHVLIIVFNHIVFDGWSASIYRSELINNYNAFIHNRPSPLPPVTKQYYHFVAAQQKRVQGVFLENTLDFWKKYLTGLPPLRLPVDKPRKQEVPVIKEYKFNFPMRLSASLKQLSKAQSATLFNVLFSAFCAFLYRYSGQSDFSVGLSHHGREYGDLTNLIGFFVNMLPLRVNIINEMRFSELVSEVKGRIKEIIAWQEVPLEKLITGLNLTRHIHEDPFYQVSFLYENFSQPEERFENLNDDIIGVESGRIPCDLSVEICANADSFDVSFKYNDKLYEVFTVQRIAECWIELLQGVVHDFNEKIDCLPLLTAHERRQLLEDWNRTDQDYPANKSIHQLFEEQVKQRPNTIAVVCGQTQLTYQLLNERANQVAYYLIKNYNIIPDTLVVLCMDRSAHLLIAILAILKAGGAYVPVDPAYPDERIRYILEDTEAKIVLTDEVYEARLKNITVTNVLAIDSKKSEELIKNEPLGNVGVKIANTHLAYVIYTSGTTDTPKGVMIEHQGVINYIFNVSTHIGMSSEHRVDFSTNIGFDLTVTNTLCALCLGSQVVIYANQLHDIECYKDYLIQNKINIIKLVPSYFELIVNILPMTQVNKIILGGEKLSATIINKLHQVYGNKKDIDLTVYDEYGPTETTVGACCSIVYPDTNLTIGKPYFNYKVYVLNAQLKPLPIGAVGELYIGGLGLARGYLNQSRLTEERFITNPFQTEADKEQNKNVRLYKTGDLVRWLHDGNLEYVGRNDCQVKMRGYRIGLEEIAKVLSTYPGIIQSVVLARGAEEVTSGKYLVGYYVADNKLNEEDILEHLQNQLPAYMVPTILVHLEQLPLTMNGKLNEEALPEPKLTQSKLYIAPRNELETKVCQIWEQVLGLAPDTVGIQDDFFRLGGDSILTIKVLNRINQILNLSINLSALFKYSSVEKFVNHLKHDTEETLIPKAKVIHPEEHPLSFAQERLWFINEYEGGTNAYNIPMVFKLKDGISLERLEKAIKEIVNRHEILRTVIKEDAQGRYYQLVLDTKIHPFEIIKVKSATQAELDQALSEAVNYVYDLGNEPPIRVCVLEWNQNCYLSIVIHHIAFDGWSIGIFFKELEAYYFNLATTLNLPTLSIQYKDFALWQRSYLKGARFESQLNYWKSKLNKYETLNLKTDMLRPKQVNYQGEDLTFELTESISLALKKLAKELKTSLYTVLLSAYYLMVRCYSNQDDIVIGIPIANRHYSQLENLIGFFVNSLPLRKQIEPRMLIKEFIENVGSDLVAAQLHQDLPFESLVEELKVSQDSSRHPVFQVMFGLDNFAGIFQQEENTLSKLNEVLQLYYPGINFHNTAKFDLCTFVDDSQVCLRGTFNYATNLYTDETIKNYINTYIEILKQLANLSHNFSEREQTRIADLYYLSVGQYHQFLEDWNLTDRDYPVNKSIHQLFEEQVKQRPNTIAVVCGQTQLTYQMLNERANQVAHYLIETYNIIPDTLVVLCMDRSAHLLIAILAILKAGGAYVPVDPAYPDERIRYILEDTDAKIVLTDEVYEARLKNITVTNILAIDSKKAEELIKNEPLENVGVKIANTHLAYVIYTSGTTDTPKGVMIEHQGVINYLFNVSTHIGMSSEHRVDFSTNIGFDLTVTNTLCALCLGSQVVIYANQLHDIECYKDYLIQNKINIIKLVPSYFELIVNILPMTQVSKIILGGEKLSATIINKLREVYGNKKDIDLTVYDEYGPTETTVGACCSIVYPDTNLTIGKPYFNYKVYVLNAQLKPLPIGAVGELYIGGLGLARGYLNQSRLTEERFITNPFQTEADKEQNKNVRLYKTGDLVRWLHDGNLEYVGRNDCQVKMRGYRIGLEEIARVLSTYPGIIQSVVLARGAEEVTSGKYLVGYYVADNKLNEEDILEHYKTSYRHTWSLQF